MQDNKYLLSICIPTFNRAGYLDKNLKFLSEQKDIDKVQIVVADNCSTDNTFDIVNKYNCSLNLKYFKHSKNVGIYSNLDSLAGISDATYIWILGDDDIIAENSIPKVLKIIKDKDINLCYVNQKMYESNIPKTNIPKTIKINQDKIYKDGRDLFVDVSMTLQFISAIIIKKEKMIKAIKKYNNIFIVERHVIQFLDVMSKGKCYLVSEPLILIGYSDEKLSRNKYDETTFFGDDCKTKKFDWYDIFFRLPNYYIQYAQENLGYKDKHLNYFKYYQNKQFLKTYIYSKKEGNYDKYKHISITQGKNVLFGFIFKALFVISYITPPFILKGLWFIFVKIKKIILAN
ncbi:MAG: glycosyltransferase [Helicobacteraceae bacterium]|nr:glycosyltransferase [Helicobacteraceae bacterium]